jgi:hypothetical protein
MTFSNVNIFYKDRDTTVLLLIFFAMYPNVIILYFINYMFSFLHFPLVFIVLFPFQGI